MNNAASVEFSIDELEQLLTTRPIREAFKYTSAKKLLTALTESAAPDAPELTDTAELTGTKGLSVTTRQLPTLLAENKRYPFVGLSRHFSQTEVNVHVPTNYDSDKPLKLHHTLRSNAWLNLHLEPNAELTFIETEHDKGCLTSNIAITLEPGARLHHHRCLFGADTSQYHATQVSVQDNACYELNHYAGGSKLRRVDHLVQLVGAGAKANMTGAYALAPNSHLDQNFTVEHIAAQCHSEHLLNGICFNGAKSSFSGRIHIHPQAQKSDAHLTNKNLILGTTAEVNTKPELEIYADDVVCSHGATVGQLDENSIFYLRSRGIPQAQAKTQLAQAFLFAQVTGELKDSASEAFSQLLAEQEVN